MLSTKQVCCICGQDLTLEHRTTAKNGLVVHTSCHEKQMLLNAATRQTELWRQNFPRGKTA